MYGELINTIDQTVKFIDLHLRMHAGVIKKKHLL